jgi:hypothetical protein
MNKRNYPTVHFRLKIKKKIMENKCHYSSVQCYQIKRIDCCLMSSEYYFRYIHNDNTHKRGGLVYY